MVHQRTVKKATHKHALIKLNEGVVSLVAHMIKNLSACNAGDSGSIPRSGRSPGEGYGNPLQYSCLGNPTEEPGGLQSMGLQSWT